MQFVDRACPDGHRNTRLIFVELQNAVLDRIILFSDRLVRWGPCQGTMIALELKVLVFSLKVQKGVLNTLN